MTRIQIERLASFQTETSSVPHISYNLEKSQPFINITCTRSERYLCPIIDWDSQEWPLHVLELHPICNYYALWYIYCLMQRQRIIEETSSIWIEGEETCLLHVSLTLIILQLALSIDWHEIDSAFNHKLAFTGLLMDEWMLCFGTRFLVHSSLLLLDIQYQIKSFYLLFGIGAASTVFTGWSNAGRLISDVIFSICGNNSKHCS